LRVGFEHKILGAIDVTEDINVSCRFECDRHRRGGLTRGSERSPIADLAAHVETSISVGANDENLVIAFRDHFAS